MSCLLTGWHLKLVIPMSQAFEIESLQNVRPDAGFVARLGGVIANAVEADVERQITLAVEGKKQVRNPVFELTIAGGPGSQAAVAGPASQKHANPASSHEGGPHPQQSHGSLARRQVLPK